MRAPLLVASSTALAVATGLSPLMMAGPGGWVGAALCGMGLVFFTKLRDSHVEADVRAEIALETTRDAPIAPTLPACLSAIPALKVERRNGLNIVSLRASMPSRGLPAVELRTKNGTVLRKGDPVSFPYPDWDHGEITCYGTAELLADNGNVTVRLDNGNSYVHACDKADGARHHAEAVMTSPAHLKAIHTLKGRAGLAEDEFRALLHKHTGQTSSKALSDQSAGHFLTVLKGFAGEPSGSRPAASRATGPYAPVLQALWLSAFHLGLARNKTDSALLSFVERQTGMSHTRFLTDHADAQKAIEGLKAWLVRDGGVIWPPERGEDATLARKEAVVRAIARRLVAIGDFKPWIAGEDPWPGEFEVYAYGCGLPASFRSYGADEWHRVTEILGSRLRRALAKRTATEASHG